MQGHKCMPYINTATGEGAYGAPVWGDLTLSRDVEISDARNSQDDSDRSSDQESEDAGMRKISWTMEVRYKPGNDAFDALRDAYENNTLVDMFFADAPGGPNAPGRRGDFKITQFNVKQSLKDKVVVSVAGTRNLEGGHTYGPYTYPD